jgi:hypothetical protein
LALRFPAQKREGRRIRGFLPFAQFGTHCADLLAWPSDHPPAGSGRKKMTFGTAQQLAVSLVAALATSALFVSAAIGPVVQFA